MNYDRLFENILGERGYEDDEFEDDRPEYIVYLQEAEDILDGFNTKDPVVKKTLKKVKNLISSAIFELS